MYNRTCLVLLLALFFVNLLSAQQIDATVVTIKLTKMEQISLRTLNAEIAKYAKAWATQGKTLTDQDKTDILWMMIDMVLFRQAAERDSVQVSDAQLNAAIAQRKQALSTQLGHEATEEDLRAQLAQQGLTWNGWTASLKDQLLPQTYVARMKAGELKNVQAPSDDDVEWYYQTNIQKFTIATMIEFKHIFGETSGKTDAQASLVKARLETVLNQIRSGDTFESLVKGNSDDTETRNRDGYAGILQVDSTQAKALGKSFVQGLLHVKEGQISDVLQSPAGYHIVKVVRVIQAKLYSLNEKVPPTYQQTTADAIRQVLLATAQQNMLNTELEKTKMELRKEAEIHFTDRDIGFTRGQ